MNSREGSSCREGNRDTTPRNARRRPLYNPGVVELTRTVRFCLSDPAGPGWEAEPKSNTFAGWPAMRGLGRYYELLVRCRGDVDPVSGYFLNIRHIDQAVRQAALPHLFAVVNGPGGSSAVAMGALMRRLSELIQPALGGSVESLRLALTPFYSLEIRSRDMDQVLLRHQYEFSASHRLHVPAWSEQKNKEVFGKCNNPAGHGHNYKLEVAVIVSIDPHGRVPDVSQLDALVDQHVIEKLDHKHLNTDVVEFRALNPSVENIARVIHDLLEGPVAGVGSKLDEICIWETGKTVCTFRKSYYA